MAYTTIDNPELYFQTKLFTGNGSTQSITLDGSENMQPDFVWFKNRSSTQNHRLFDIVRGAGKNLVSNNTGAEIDAGTGTGGQLRTFDSDGFSVGSDNSVNKSSENICSWNWKAGGASTSTNSDGDIDGTQTVSQTAGFSVTTYSGNGGSNQSLGHGLGATPKVYICKRRDNTGQWLVMNTITDGTLDYLFFETSGGKSDTATTLPTSSLVYLQNGGDANESGGTHVCYAFAEKQGFSKFGNYVGNGSTNGTYVHLGFRPAYVLCKTSSISGEDWIVSDNKRNLFNETTTALFPNSASGDQSSNSIDMLSNGFKMRTTGTYRNQSGVTYIYMAFAENPFVTSTGVPTTAR